MNNTYSVFFFFSCRFFANPFFLLPSFSYSEFMVLSEAYSNFYSFAVHINRGLCCLLFSPASPLLFCVRMFLLCRLKCIWNASVFSHFLLLCLRRYCYWIFFPLLHWNQMINITCMRARTMLIANIQVLSALCIVLTAYFHRFGCHFHDVRQKP